MKRKIVIVDDGRSMTEQEMNELNFVITQDEEPVASLNSKAILPAIHTSQESIIETLTPKSNEALS